MYTKPACCLFYYFQGINWRPLKFLVDALRVTLPLLLAQDILLQLARTGLWQLFDNHNTRGALESRHILLTEGDQLVACDNLVGRKTRFEDHKGLRGFSPSWVRDRNDCDFEDGGVLGDARFYFEG